MGIKIVLLKADGKKWAQSLASDMDEAEQFMLEAPIGSRAVVKIEIGGRVAYFSRSIADHETFKKRGDTSFLVQ